MDVIVQILSSGLTIGAMYAVSTIGLALVYGSLNMLNMSHGALLALGGYVCLYAMASLGLPALLAVPAAMAVCGVAGLLIYHLAARPMLSSRNFETQIFIATIGIGAVLENLILRTFGPQPVAQPLNLAGAITIGGVHIPSQNILILAVSVSMMVAVAVLVVTCPCALSLATPAAMLAAAGNLARGGVLVRRLQGLEALAKVDTLVFDKTGTLTRDAMVLDAVETREGVLPEQALAMAAALAQHSLHPVSRALVNEQASRLAASQQQGGQYPTWLCDAVTESAGEGVAGLAQGSCLNVAGASPVSLRLGSASYCSVPARCVPGLQVHLRDDQGWLASFVLQEDLRPQAAEAVSAMRALGIDVFMLSGDGVMSVARVSAQAGITPKTS